MAIFKRLINSSSLNKPFGDSPTESDVAELLDETRNLLPLCWYPYKRLRRDAMRFMIFSEQGNRLLYDSETVVALSDRKLTGCRKSKCGNFQFLPHSGDATYIAKMVFGTMTTSSKTDSFKMHTLINTDALMISRVFSGQKLEKKKVFNNASENVRCLAGSISSDSDSQLHYATIRSLDAIRETMKGTKVVSSTNTDPPEGFTRLRNSSLQFESCHALMEELRAFSPNQLSRARRKQLSLKGLCDDESSHVFGNRSRLSSCSSMTENNGGETGRQYGIALFFPGDDKDFVFQHILQVEKEIFKLISSVHLAIASRAQFLNIIYEGWVNFCSSVSLLHNASRLKTPVWLSLTNPLVQDVTANEFCLTLARLSDQMNTKETNFFLSTLISCVLMNHLSWVASVSPPESCSYDRSLLLGTSVIDQKRNPYNAMAAQFLELSGGIGMGNVFAKTVVFGVDPRLISEVLYVLSYFIRCSSVENKRKEIMTPDSLSPMKSFLDESPIDGIPIQGTDNKSRVPNNKDVLSPCECVTEFDAWMRNDHRQQPLTPPPAKIRAVGTFTNSKHHSPQLSQQNSTASASQRHYELILDVKDVNNCVVDLSPPSYLSLSPNASNRTDVNNADAAERPIDFGRSLLAGVCNSYSPHFILSGIDKRFSKTEDIYADIKADVSSSFANFPSGLEFNIMKTMGGSAGNSLMSPSTSAPLVTISAALKVGSLNESISSNTNNSKTHLNNALSHQNSCQTVDSLRSSHDDSGKFPLMSDIDTKTKTVVVVAADCADFVVRIISGEDGMVDDRQVFSPSEAVASMLEEFVELYRHNCAATFLISFLEDRLGSILSKSNVLTRLVTTSDDGRFGSVTPESNAQKIAKKVMAQSLVRTDEPLKDEKPTDDDDHDRQMQSEFISMEHMSSILGCHCSDLRLILNVATVYSPLVQSSVM